MADTRTTNLNLYKIGSSSDNVGVHMIDHYNYNVGQLDAWIAAHDIASISYSSGILTITSKDGTTHQCTIGDAAALIAALDYSDSPVAGKYVTAVSETDGKISVTREAADASPTQSSNKMVTSGGVYSALSGKADKATTLAGYGINNAYTKTEVDSKFTGVVSDAYNAATTYVVGEHFIYNDVIYTVDVACTGITPPNANYYTPNKLTDLIESNASQISTIKSNNLFQLHWCVAYIKLTEYTIARDSYVDIDLSASNVYKTAGNLNSSQVVICIPTRYGARNGAIFSVAITSTTEIRLYVSGDPIDSGWVYFLIGQGT